MLKVANIIVAICFAGIAYALSTGNDFFGVPVGMALFVNSLIGGCLLWYGEYGKRKKQRKQKWSS